MDVSDGIAGGWLRPRDVVRNSVGLKGTTIDGYSLDEAGCRRKSQRLRCCDEVEWRSQPVT